MPLQVSLPRVFPPLLMWMEVLMLARRVHLPLARPTAGRNSGRATLCSAPTLQRTGWRVLRIPAALVTTHIAGAIARIRAALAR